MSKRSTATVRARPVEDVSAAVGGLRVHSETLIVRSDRRVQIVDLTEDVMTLVRRLPVREGLANVFSLHTTCAVFINENQTALLGDIETFLEQTVPQQAPWRHNDQAQSDCDRFNADAHLRALMLGHHLTLQVSGHEPVLGQWQRVLAAELDGPRDRSVRVQVMGIA